MLEISGTQKGERGFNPLRLQLFYTFTISSYFHLNKEYVRVI